MRIVWHSAAPWAPTGYGGQTATFTPRLRDLGHELILSAFWGLQGAVWEWDGMPVYPSDDQWGHLYLPEIMRQHAPAQLITLMDVWPLSPAMLESFGDVACWVPIDHAPIPPKVAQVLREGRARPIAMSRFGEQELQNEGLDPLYVPHGVDTNIFKPINLDRTSPEEVGLPADRFIVGMVANNMGHTPPRKGFTQALTAFAEFQRRHADAFLYLHTNMTGGTGPKKGIRLDHVCDSRNIPQSAVGFAPQFEYEVGTLSNKALAALYNSMDVLLNPSYGEGFGIPIVEAQACGVPVIVTDWTSMPELVGAGWVVGGQPYYDPQHYSDFMEPSIPAIVDALESAYDSASGMRYKAREFAIRYDADLVTENYWKPALEKLGRPREVPPLNRAARRRMAREKTAA